MSVGQTRGHTEVASFRQRKTPNGRCSAHKIQFIFHCEFWMFNFFENKNGFVLNFTYATNPFFYIHSPNSATWSTLNGQTRVRGSAPYTLTYEAIICKSNEFCRFSSCRTEETSSKHSRIILNDKRFECNILAMI